VRLFVARAQAVKADFHVTAENAPVVAAICQRLDGLPLAIELAVARLRLLSPQALLARLEHRLPLLTGGARDLPARQQTLANTIAWSYDLLESHEQVLFRRLGVFRGGCTLEAAEAVCGEQGTQESPLLHRVEALVAQSLLLQQDQPDGEVRFTMLETLREFAWEQLQLQGEVDTVQQRHLDYYLPWTVEACRHVHWADQLEWMARLDREEDNLRAGLGWCVQRGQAGDPQATEAGLQLAGALGHWYWAIHSRSAEGLAWLEQLLSLPGAAQRSAGRARALLAAGLLTLWSGWFPRGGTTPTWALYEEARAIGQELDDKSIGAMACMGLGYSLPDRAGQRARREDALGLYREVGDAWGIAFGLWALGEYHAYVGDLATAQTFLDQGIRANTGVGDRSLSANAQQALAHLAMKRGDVARAQALLKQSLQPSRELHDQRSIGLTITRLATVALLAGDRAVAHGYYCQALPIFLDSGDSGASADALMGLASLALQEGAPVRAVRLAGAAHVAAKPGAWHVIGDWGYLPDALQIREAAARVVSEEDVAQSWAEGQVMTLEQAIAYALAEDGQRSAIWDAEAAVLETPHQDDQQRH
jgi:tetratricopeptide (TPR) repeat protein